MTTTLDPEDLHFASASDAARAIRQGDISSVELTTYLLERIHRYNPSLNVIVTLLEEDAIKKAAAADAALARKEWWGPLHGVPVTIKDTFAIADVRTTAGAQFLSEYIPSEDAAAVAKLRKAGAILLGHTNVPWPAADWQTYNSIFGTTNNPWDLTRTPGGSTGGAAAVAAGLSFLSLGTDLGGSIRVPSHFCGLYGHKPTLNLIPYRGQVPPPPGVAPQEDMSVAGVLGRSAEDLKTAIEVLGGPDKDEAIAYRWTLPPARGKQLSDYRIGFVLDDPHCPVSSSVRQVLAAAIDLLRASGAHLAEGWPTGVNPLEQYRTYRFNLSGYFESLFPDDTPEKMRERAKQDGSLDALEAWGWKEPQPYQRCKSASYARLQARSVWQEFFKSHDAFLLPVSFVSAFPHDHSQLKSRILSTPEGPRAYEDLLFWISFATMTGLPASVAPVGLTAENLPVGIQIIGPYLEDATPIDLAAKITSVVGGFRQPEGY